MAITLEPGVGGGHHLYPDGAGLRLSGCRVLDWFSRRVSITMEAAFCVKTLEDALARHGKPDIFNTDQGSQFTGSVFTGVLADNDMRLAWTVKELGGTTSSSSGCGSVKYEEVYLRAYDSVSEARASIGRCLGFYNGRRPHSSLDGSTPDKAYFNPPPQGFQKWLALQDVHRFSVKLRTVHGRRAFLQELRPGLKYPRDKETAAAVLAHRGPKQP